MNFSRATEEFRKELDFQELTAQQFLHVPGLLHVYEFVTVKISGLFFQKQTCQPFDLVIQKHFQEH